MSIDGATDIKLLNSLLNATPKKELFSHIKPLTLRRLATYMQTESMSDKASSYEIEGCVSKQGKLANSKQKDALANGRFVEEDIASKATLSELVEIKNGNNVVFDSVPESSIHAICSNFSDDSQDLYTLMLYSRQSLFLKEVCNQMPDVINFIKSDEDEEVEINDLKLSQLFFESNESLKRYLLSMDEQLCARSISNILATYTYNELVKKADTTPSISKLLFHTNGNAFSDYLLKHALSGSNVDLAKNLLTHSDYGYLSKDNHKDQDTSEFELKTPDYDYSNLKELLSIVCKDDDSAKHIKEIVSTISNEEDIDNVLDAIISVHDTYYNPSNVKTALEACSSNLNQDLVLSLAKRLGNSWQYQPTVDALKQLNAISNKKGFDTSHIDDYLTVIDERILEHQEKINTLPTAKYTNVSLVTDKFNDNIFIKDIQTSAQLKLALEELSERYEGMDVKCDVKGSGSRLDDLVIIGLHQFLKENNPAMLNELLFNPISKLDNDLLLENDNLERDRLYFEASQQAMISGTSGTQSIDEEEKTFTQRVDEKVFLRQQGKPIISLTTIRSSNDLLNLDLCNDSGRFTVDETGFGDQFDEALEEAINALVDEPDNMQNRVDIDNLVGLPPDKQYSKIIESSDNTLQKPTIKEKATNVSRSVGNAIVNRMR